MQLCWGAIPAAPQRLFIWLFTACQEQGHRPRDSIGQPLGRALGGSCHAWDEPRCRYRVYLSPHHGQSRVTPWAGPRAPPPCAAPPPWLRPPPRRSHPAVIYCSAVI